MGSPTYPRRTSGDRPAARTGPILLLFLLAVPPAVVAILAVLGLGAARGGPPLGVAVGAIALVALPALGLSGLLRNRPAAMVAALLVWSLALLFGLPLYFPGERGEAIARGASFIGNGTVAQPSERSVRFGRAIDRFFGGDEPEPPLAIAEIPASPPPEELAPDEPPPSPAEIRGGDPLAEATSVEYHGEGNMLRIPVVFEGPSGGVAVSWMIFDTGATFTTLDEKTLKAIGVSVHHSDPTVTLHTATGRHRVRLVLVDSVTVGGRRVDGVTVAVCDTCAVGEISGLLGLNVTGQFQTTFDPDQQRLLVRPLAGTVNRKLDLDAWLIPQARLFPLENQLGIWVQVDNRAHRHVDEVILEVDCPDRHHELRLMAIPARGSAEKHLIFPGAAQCNRPEVRILRGSW